MKFVSAIILFSFIILFHELGHFLLAKKNGVYVEAFTLGLGPTIIGKEFHGTKYCLKLLPFGGSCMMKGEEDDSMSFDSFNSKTVWQRFQIIFAGPFFNFILAFILSAIIIACVGASLPIIGDVSDNAAKAGLKPGDRIVKLDNKKINHTTELTLYGVLHQEKSDVHVVYERDGKQYETDITRYKEDNRYLMGIRAAAPVKVGPLGILTNAFYETKMNITMVFDSFAYLFSGHGSIKDVSGPVGIVKSIGTVYDNAKKTGVSTIILSLMSFGVMLSANLGVMNLLPLPALDGGRIVFLIGEAITRKRIPIKIEQYINAGGLLFLLGLIILITFKDIFI